MNLELEFFNLKRNRTQWRIQDFPEGGVPTPENAIIFRFFAENCMKMKEFGPPGGARPWPPPLDPPMVPLLDKVMSRNQ